MSTIVYIDDEPTLCRVFEMVVAPTGATVKTFTDPREALAFLAVNEVAVVLCDLRMPRMSGADVLARLGGTVPFYMVSGDLDVTLWKDDARIAGILAKPYTTEALLDIVARYASARPG